jgi:hypothetical protein
MGRDEPHAHLDSGLWRRGTRCIVANAIGLNSTSTNFELPISSMPDIDYGVAVPLEQWNVIWGGP